ncbi:hypothetical protein OG410_40480 [Streptomyces sp. NBC_00659]|uniref:hypothetical protein n=1 Tax=Streptomyces sp. NBC_00659 TaxID=2903669 RepID=UPI002E2EB070|nr:hypothetical protein [Streptomyces sp. NBC_00659]
MFDRARNNPRVLRITEWYYWDDMLDAVSHLVRSRAKWVILGNLSTLACAIASTVYHWTRPFTFADYLTVQLACLACQAVALFPVGLPGRTASPEDASGFSALHESLALTIVCVPSIFFLCPGLALLMFLDVNPDGSLYSAVLLPAVALTLACVAGLISGVFLSSPAESGSAAGPPGTTGGTDWSDSGYSADTDSGYDGD